jgi:hypothetical protein
MADEATGQPDVPLGPVSAPQDAPLGPVTQTQDQPLGPAPTTPVEKPGLGAKIASAAADLAVGVAESPVSIAKGAYRAGFQTLKTAGDVAGMLDKTLGTPPTAIFDRSKLLGHLDPGEPDDSTTTGKFIDSTAQFVTSVAGIGKIAKGLSLAGKAPAAIEAAIKGAAAMGISFDPQSTRLSNLIEQYPSLSNPVTRFLQSDPNDGDAEGRFKNSLEGLGLGATMEGIFSGVKALKGFMSGDHEQAIADAAKAVVDQSKPVPAAEPTGMPGASDATEQAAQPQKPFMPPPAATPADFKPQPGVPELKGFDSKTISDYSKLVNDSLSERSMEEAPGATLAAKGIDLPFENIHSDDDAKIAINSMAAVASDAVNQAKGGVQSWEDTKLLASGLGTDPVKLMTSMQNAFPTIQNLAALQKASGDFVVNLAQRVATISKVIDEGRAGVVYNSVDEAHQSLAQHGALLDQMYRMLTGTRTNIARALNSMKMGYGAEASGSTVESGGSAAIDLSNPTAIGAFAKRVNLAAGTIDPVQNPMGFLNAVMKNTTVSFAQKATNAVTGTFINSLLSTKTAFVKTAGDFLNVGMFQPAEQFLKGVYMRDPAQALQAGQQYVGMVKGVTDSIRLAAKSFMSGQQILDTSSHFHTLPFEMGDGGVLSALANGDPAAAVVNSLAHSISLPGRLITGIDELSKQISYRGKVYGEGWRAATEKGLQGQDKADAIQAYVNSAFDARTGAATNSNALNYARAGTYTTDPNTIPASDFLQNGHTLSSNVQNGLTRYPGARLIIPFVKVVSNLQRFAWTHTPGLNLLQKEFRQDLLSGGPKSAEAFSKATTGGLAWAGALSLAASGHITGQGPTDPMARSELMDTGWRPYSYKVGDTYYDFHRLDPLASFLGMAADTYSVGKHISDEDYGTLASGLGMAVMHNFNAKNYFSGLNNLFDAMSPSDARTTDAQENKAEKFFGSYLSGFAPGNLANANNDPYMREARGVIDQFMKRIPGLSENVDPVRNTLGERVKVDQTLGPRFLSPVAVSEDHHDPVQDELARQAALSKGAFAPPTKMLKLPGAPQGGTVDLTQFRGANGYSAYDRLQELAGTSQIQGKTMRQALGDLFNSDQYKNQLTDSTAQYNGSRKQAIDEKIGAYRMAAEDNLIKENSAVKAAAYKSAADAHAAQINQGVAGNTPLSALERP